jgi:hypothetical protein
MPLFDLILAKATVPLVPGFIILSYSLWIKNKRSDTYRSNPIVQAIAILVSWSAAWFFILIKFDFPQGYVQSVRIIARYEFKTGLLLQYDFAVIVTALSFKFVASHFVAIRLARTFIGACVAFLGFYLVGFGIYLAILWNAQDFLARQSLPGRELAECFAEIAAYVLPVVVVMIMDIVGFYTLRLADRGRAPISRAWTVFFGTSSFLGLALLGLILLGPWAAFLWTMIVIVGFPPIMAIFSTLQPGGQPFTPRLVARMYVVALIGIRQTFVQFSQMFRR